MTRSGPVRVACDMTFPDRNRGGVGRYARGLLQALDECEGVEPVAIRSLSRRGPLGTMRWLTSGAAHEVGRVRADVLHCPAFASPWRCRLPCVITVHDNSVVRHPGGHPLEWRVYATRVLPERARRAAAVIVPSDFVRTDIIDAWRLPEDRVVAVPLGIDPRFQPAAGARERDAASLLFVGAPLPRKNLDVVLRAVAAGRRGSALAGAELVITGATAREHPGHARTIESLGLTSRVRWLGRVVDDEMPRLYRKADVLVYPSLEEGFGLPPLEAMASGTPAITSTAGALPETVGEGATLVDPRDPEALAAAIEALLTDVSLRRTMIAAGLARAAGFTWSSCAAATAAVYRRVLAA